MSKSIDQFFLTITEFSRSVFGVATGNCNKAIFAFQILVGPPEDVLGLHLLKTKPYTNQASYIVPPNFLTILMSLRSTLLAVLVSITFMIALTAISAYCSAEEDKTFELNDVVTHLVNV